MSDALEQAKRELDIATSALSATGTPRPYAEMTRAAESAQAAALIALVEEVRTLNAILHDATDLNGAIKIVPDQEVKDQLEKIVEHIEDPLAIIGPCEPIKVVMQ